MRAIRRILVIVIVFATGLAAGLAPTYLSLGSEAEEHVLFEPALSTGPDPFTPPAVSGSGPYGGTGSDDRCDQELLISFLLAHPDRLAAWAGVQNISPEEVPSFIRSLRPKVLTENTKVVNHGFRNGRAYSFLSELEAGTAVLVDEDGNIVVRCRCGNPLKDPDCPDCKPDDECPTWDPDCRPDDYCPPGDPRCKPDRECPTYDPRCWPDEEDECVESHIHGYLQCPDDEDEDEGEDRPEGEVREEDPEDDGSGRTPEEPEDDGSRPTPERPNGDQDSSSSTTSGSPTPQ